MRKIIITSLTICILTSTSLCQTKKQNLHLTLEKGIELKAEPAYPDEDISTFNFLEIIQDSKKIFKDTTLAEYAIDDSMFPKLLDFGTHLELLVEIDNRPNKNLIYKFSIQNHKLIKIDTLPTFLTYAKNLDDDKNLEYAGFWDYGQVWGDPVEVTAYNPLIFYEITNNGIILDSLTTIKINTEIYGKFYGFNFSELIEIPYKKDSKFTQEIQRIKK